MPEPLSMNSGFGINVAVLPRRRATFLTTYLYIWSLSAIRFSLSGSRDFVMVDFNLHADAFQSQHDFGSDVLKMIHRRNGEVSFLVAGLVAEIRTFFFSGVPDTGL